MSKNSKILVILCVFSVAAPAFADSQTVHRSVLRKHRVSETQATANPDELGFQLGLSLGSGDWSVDHGQEPNLDTRTRPTFGFYYEHAFLPYLAVRPELNYVQRGFSSNQNNQTTEVAANYVELPILAKGQYSFGQFTPYFLTGPFLGINTGSGSTTEGNSQNVEESLKVNTFNFGWDFGLGSTYALTKQFKVEASIRYSLGLTNTYASGSSGQSVTLSAFQFLSGVNMAI